MALSTSLHVSPACGGRLRREPIGGDLLDVSPAWVGVPW
jgi:hypothetical protein